MEHDEGVEEIGSTDSPRFVSTLAIKSVQYRHRAGVNNSECGRHRDVEKVVVKRKIDVERMRQGALIEERGK